MLGAFICACAEDVHGEPIAESHTDEQAAEHAEAQAGAHGSGEPIGAKLPLWAIIPFAGILLSIAIFPLVAPHFWHEHFPKVSAFWALVFALPFLLVFRGAAIHEILHIYLVDYIPFIILLWALFTTAGGILVKGALRGTPTTNTILLLIGTAIASWVGTTGAAMIMIRPVLRANGRRRYKVHTVVFFIFLVANIGGSLTPLGDPPLFLGFLHGVPFFWTMRLLPHMGFVVAMLLAFYLLMDTYYYRKDLREKPELAQPVATEPVRVKGAYNLLFLAGIVGSVLMSGTWKPGFELNVFGIHMPIQNLLRDLLLICMGLLSLAATPKAVREENEFTWFPIKEVAYLFAGIFMTIIPAIAILRAGEQGAFAPLMRAIEKPWHYFWITGSLSSFLDNAPTYLTFFNTALGKFFAGMAEKTAVPLLITEKVKYLAAISAGAVFMGANTYIGNAPNFMVRSIAEERGIPMPSFFGYMLKYSIPILIPLFVLVNIIFFRGA